MVFIFSSDTNIACKLLTVNRRHHFTSHIVFNVMSGSSTKTDYYLFIVFFCVFFLCLFIFVKSVSINNLAAVALLKKIMVTINVFLLVISISNYKDLNAC